MYIYICLYTLRSTILRQILKVSFSTGSFSHSPTLPLSLFHFCCSISSSLSTFIINYIEADPNSQWLSLAFSSSLLCIYICLSTLRSTILRQILTHRKYLSFPALSFSHSPTQPFSLFHFCFSISSSLLTYITNYIEADPNSQLVISFSCRIFLSLFLYIYIYISTSLPRFQNIWKQILTRSTCLSRSLNISHSFSLSFPLFQSLYLFFCLDLPTILKMITVSMYLFLSFSLSRFFFFFFFSLFPLFPLFTLSFSFSLSVCLSVTLSLSPSKKGNWPFYHWTIWFTNSGKSWIYAI